MRSRLPNIALVVLVAVSCANHELRGKWTRSKDGKTYLVIAESPGCKDFHVDGKPWPFPLGCQGGGSLDGWPTQIRFAVGVTSVRSGPRSRSLLPWGGRDR